MIEAGGERRAEAPFWNAAAVRGARAIVVGAGELGAEVLKSLRRFGWTHVLIVDHEAERARSSPALREDDVASKAVADPAESPSAEGHLVSLRGDVRAVLSTGMVERADVLIGCADNLSARLAMSAMAGRSGRPFIDGDLTAWEGTVSIFASSHGACYGCGLDAEDLRDVGARCARPPRAAGAGGVPTMQAVASITAALMVQNCLKWIHGMRGPEEFPAGKQICVDTRHDRFWRMGLPRNATCAYHPAPPGPLLRLDGYTKSWAAILAGCRRLVGNPSASISLPFTVSTSRTCVTCARRDDAPKLYSAAEEITCAACGGELIASLETRLVGEAPWHAWTPASMGCPPWSRVSVCRGEVHEIDVEITGAPPHLEAFFERR